jgi:YVTN family beta-propeller protein
MITPNVPVYGYEFSDYYVGGIDNTEGTIAYFGNNGDPPATTGQSGVLIVNNALAPAYWNVTWFQPWNCGYNTDPSQGPVWQGGARYEGVDWVIYESENALIPNYYANKIGFVFDCYYPATLLPATTRFAILGNLPNTLTLGSEVPLTTTYGMPLLYVYGGSGSIVATQTATSVSSDGTQATFPFPSSLAQAGYSLAMVNQTGSGVGFAPAGDNLLSIASRQTIAGNPFGVAVGAQTDNWESCSAGVGGVKCSSGSEYSAFPVVSLYANNQVLVDGTAVSVGANPTAVVTYSPGSAFEVIDNGTINSYSGTTRAVVANSGSNAVSILDIVKDTVLFNVTVGNQPVALVVNSAGTEAYVANYTDSTVTPVNLSAGTASASIAVAGKPTSVALTSGGILWVGGAGFLTEINTATMAVVATENVASKTIIGLGYSDAENKIVATTLDTAGKVYVDEVNPASVTAGGAYTPVASTAVSTLGTHLNQKTGGEVQAYTATLASASTINTNQVGAPPLVVQDGWAVVTATPTGFTISDASGSDVLISETTPSPVTAIAVDSNLNVVYLTMPDSNTLLTVPLPGTN